MISGDHAPVPFHLWLAEAELDLMFAYIVRRLLFAVVVLVVISFLAFILVYLSGDPARTLAGIDANEERIAQIRESYGLDQPLHQQYLLFVGRALQGDLGRSFRYRSAVLPLVAEKFVITLKLAAASLALSIGVSVPLGIVSALRRDHWPDYFATILSLLGISTPQFWLGIILILLLSDQLRLLPPSGDEGLSSLIMPAIALSGYSIGLMTRLLRRSMIDEMEKQYVTAGRAKGLSLRQVHVRHALRNALIPTVTVAGLQLGAILGGSIVVETVFAWPGVGFLMIQAVRTNDLPVVRAVVMVVGVSFIVINLFVDILYGFLDPRIRYE